MIQKQYWTMKKAVVAKIKTGLSGVAGEYFVAAQLSRLGYVASINLRNTRDSIWVPFRRP